MNNFNANKPNSQLIAICMFSKSDGSVKFDNYSKFYQEQEEQHIIDVIESKADF